jgi:hypothetical protein
LCAVVEQVHQDPPDRVGVTHGRELLVDLDLHRSVRDAEVARDLDPAMLDRLERGRAEVAETDDPGLSGDRAGKPLGRVRLGSCAPLPSTCIGTPP